MHAVAEAVRRGRSPLKDPKRPIASFLFLGATGVGKTELCLALAKRLFGREDALLRFDMSEYSQAHAVSRLLGSPPGYVGFDEGGQLTEQVRKSPYAVLLFDEIEKAHSDMWNLLLQVMDDGHLTDAKGRRVDFRSTVLVMTSNIGAEHLTGQSLGFASGTQSAKERQCQNRSSVMASLKRTFRPEFLNRLDDILLFDALSQHEMAQIAEKQLGQIRTRLADIGIALDWDNAVLQELAQDGFDPAYGARPLRRLLQDRIESPLANQLLAQTLKAGERVSLSLLDGKLHLERQQPKPEKTI